MRAPAVLQICEICVICGKKKPPPDFSDGGFWMVAAATGELVAVVLGLVRPFDGHAEIFALLRCQLGQLDARGRTVRTAACFPGFPLSRSDVWKSSSASLRSR